MQTAAGALVDPVANVDPAEVKVVEEGVAGSVCSLSNNDAVFCKQ